MGDITQRAELEALDAETPERIHRGDAAFRCVAGLVRRRADHSARIDELYDAFGERDAADED